MIDPSNYNSTFSWRYGSIKMREIFNEQHKYEVWRKIWVELAKEQYQAGLLNKKELDDLVKHQNKINIKRILEIEKETKHDVVAAIKEFAEVAKTGGGKIHLGATSMDINDNADVYRMFEALDLIEEKLKQVLSLLSKKIEEEAETVCMGFSHLQPAEPTTVGYRLSFYGQDLLMDLELLNFVRKTFKAKGIKGAVGTGASYAALLKGKKTNREDLETRIMRNLGLNPAIISSQVYSRKNDFLVLSVLASIASSLSKFAGDLRILQSPFFGEWSEPFSKNQVGSSAMPFKRNPVNAEKICSLARMICSYPVIALENASLNYLERTLDDSANRRSIIPEGFLATDEILDSARKILENLNINKEKIERNLDQYAPFSATEAIMMEAVKRGANRQEMHEYLRAISMSAWEKVQRGRENPMVELLLDNEKVSKYLKNDEIRKLLNVKDHIGDASQRARQLVKKIRKYL